MAVDVGSLRAWVRRQPELALLAAFLLFYASWLAGDWISGDPRKLQVLCIAPADALVIYATWRAARRSEAVPWLRRFWLLVFAAWVAELAGDLGLAFYDIVLDEPTFPSLADPAFLLFYPLILAAMVGIPAAIHTRSQRLRMALDCATIAVGGAAAVWYFLLGPILSEGGERFLVIATSMAYPVGDVLLLGALALVLVRGSPETLTKSLRWLAVGLLMLICADIVYGAAQFHDSYSPGDPVDTLYVVLVAPFVLAAARQERVGAEDPRALPRPLTEPNRRLAWVPLAAMAVGFGLLLVTQWNDTFFPDLSLLILALALAALAAVRQYVVQEELVQLRGRLETIVNHVAEGIVVFEEDGTIVWVNPAGERFFGAAPGTLDGGPVEILFEGIGWKEMAPMVGVDGEPGPVIGKTVNFTGRRRDGTTFPAEIVVTEARLDGRRIMLAIGQDVSTRRFAEEALRESEQRFRGIFENAGTGIAFSAFRDGVPRIIEVNEAFCRMTGYSPEELQGNDFSLITHPDDIDDLAEMGAAVHAGEDAIVRQSRCLRRDGSILWGDLTVSIVRDKAGQPAFAIGMLADITARKEAERVKDEFVSVVGHELRTPLTSIRGSLGLLQGGIMGALSEEATEMVDTAVSNTDRLVRLINDILDIERIDSGQSELELAQVSSAELVEQSITVLLAIADEAGVELVAAGESQALTADADRVVQALVNLLGNAIKFSESGSQVTVTVASENGAAVFSVSDSGRGIPADKLEAVFERFSQVDASDARTRGGTGLGLAIARSIVERHGGRIWAESVEGEGATFRFTLPLVPVAAGAGGPR